MQAESTVPSEPQVRTSTLYLSVSGVSRWWGQTVLSGGRSVASTTAPPAPTTGLCHVLLKLLETIEKRKVLALKPQSILQWVVRNIIGLSKGKKHETSTHI